MLTGTVEDTRFKHEAGESSFSSRITFRIQVEHDSLDDRFIAKCLDLPGCMSEGETRQEAVENLVEAMAGVLEVRMQQHLHDDPDLELDLSPTRKSLLEISV